MSVGASGRIVIEIQPEMKRALYSSLSRDGQTLKDWFLSKAMDYVASSGQTPLFEELNTGVSRQLMTK